MARNNPVPEPRTEGNTMELHELLALYDQEERVKAVWPDIVREETDLVVRHRPKQTGGSRDNIFIAHTRLNSDNADRVIQEQIEYARGLGLKVGWKLYGHDQPADLDARLLLHGFTADEQESIMALELDSAPAELLQPVTADIRQIRDPEQLRDVEAVERTVWDDDQSHIIDYLTDSLRSERGWMSIYVAYDDDIPVSAAWLYLEEGRPFASLWGGSTRAEYRKRGHYTALLAVRLQEAIRRGARYLTIDASPMSRPIVQRFGFRQITTACDYDWEPAT